jgi:hypothetical protein
MLTTRKYRKRASKRVILFIGSRLNDNAFDLPVPCEIGHGFEPSSFMFLPWNLRVPPGESDGLQIKGLAQNSCRVRFDAHSKRGTESSNPPPSSGESGELQPGWD